MSIMAVILRKKFPLILMIVSSVCFVGTILWQENFDNEASLIWVAIPRLFFTVAVILFLYNRLVIETDILKQHPFIYNVFVFCALFFLSMWIIFFLYFV